MPVAIRICWIEIGGGQALKMDEKLVSQTLFNSSGGTQKASTPDIAKGTDTNSDCNHIKCIYQQLPAFDLEPGQIIDRLFDDARDE
jgi:hypothetical protein